MSVVSFLTLVIISALYNSVRSDLFTSYCEITCNRASHTVCDRSNVYCRPAGSCGYIHKPQMTDELRQALLDKHNELRNKVAKGEESKGPQPKAGNMNALNWNFELEFIAQCWANTCEFKHDSCRNGKSMKAGQNLAVQSTTDGRSIAKTEETLKSVIGWYDEVKDSPPSLVDKFGPTSGPAIGHYTQLVWGNAEYLGCGRSVYFRDGWYHMYLVCNYGGKEGGNMRDSPMYLKGEPCSKCPSGRSCNAKYGGLCGADKRVKDLPHVVGAAAILHSSVALLVTCLFQLF